MAETMGTQLTDREFRRVSDLVQRLCGINLHDGKEQLVQGRLGRRLRVLRLNSYSEYLDYIEADRTGAELGEMLDVLTTNKTSFFREPAHFDFIRTHLAPKWQQESRRIRIWSAGCSTGEEPFTLAMLLTEILPEKMRHETRILATDLSKRVLHHAERGEYTQHELEGLPADLLKRYFTLKSVDRYRLNSDIRSLVSFAQLNLLEDWPMKGPFDAIFCRNVMIYFDKPTQQRLIPRFWRILAPGGHLFIGHSESLSGITHDFEYVQPALFYKDR